MALAVDDQELMRNMHRPDPKQPPEMQHKRMVVILPDGLYEAWLDAPAANSMNFMRQFPAERLLATAEPIPPKPNVGKTGSGPASGQAELI